MNTPYAEYIDSATEWLDEMPAHWRVARLGHVAAAWTSNVDKHSVDGQPPVRLCNYTDVYKNDAIIEGMDFMRATATSEQIARFRLRRGDTIITKDSETADDIGIPAYVAYEAADLVCGYHLAMIRPDKDAVLPRFLYWVMNAKPTLRQWEVLAAGVTRVGIRSVDLTKAAVALPPMSEQGAISAYLDRETQRIDALVAEQVSLVEVLRERRAAVISHAVTRGLREHPVVATDHPYLSEAPSTWRMSRLSREMIINGGQVDPRQEPWVDMVLVAPNHIESGTGRLVGRETAREQGADSGKYLARQGQVLYSKIRPALNKVTVAVEDCLCSADMYAMSSRTLGDPRFAMYFMLARPFHIYATQQSLRVKMPKVNREELGAAPWLVPPVEEQRQIADHLDDQTKKIDALIAEAEGIVTVAKERRSALITAAVTGQIDVRGEVA